MKSGSTRKVGVLYCTCNLKACLQKNPKTMADTLPCTPHQPSAAVCSY